MWPDMVEFRSASFEITWEKEKIEEKDRRIRGKTY